MRNQKPVAKICMHKITFYFDADPGVAEKLFHIMIKIMEILGIDPTSLTLQSGEDVERELREA